MINIYKTDNMVISEIENVEPGCWIKMTSPSTEELATIAEQCAVDVDDLRSAMDDEETSRLEIEDDYFLILVDIPTSEVRNNRHTYTTIPLGILVLNDKIITVCQEDTVVLLSFINRRMRDFSTKKQMRFTYQILYNVSMLYQSLLRNIDRKRTEIEARVEDNTEDEDLVDLHELESNLVYFATSLRSNGVVLDRLTRYGSSRQYEEDRDLLDDVLIENRQAIEMTAIYREVVIGTRELLSSVINNRLNSAMKYLAAITIIMSIPNIISGFYGMNVDETTVPLAKAPYGFGFIALITAVVCTIAMIIMHKRKML